MLGAIIIARREPEKRTMKKREGGSRQLIKWLILNGRWLSPEFLRP